MVGLYNGRTKTQRDRLAKATTEENVTNILKVKRKDVIIMFQGSPHENWYASGIHL
jgi:phenylpyruvate tautomerase PptA (4-oxalocrotonate tautomerase family)